MKECIVVLIRTSNKHREFTLNSLEANRRVRVWPFGLSLAFMLKLIYHLCLIMPNRLFSQAKFSLRSQWND